MKLKTTILIIIIILLTVTLASAGNYSNQSRHLNQDSSVTPVKNNVHNSTVSGTSTQSNDNSNRYPHGLVNNPKAKDPTFNQLVNFIKSDQTDKKLYSDNYMCDSSARDVHNNAEAAGIRTGYVDINLVNLNDKQFCDAFNTTDKGLVFIDCTGDPYKMTANCDTIVKVANGIVYHPKSLYPPYDRDYTQGKIHDFKIYW
jgi:hypothetical protein